MNSRLRWRSDQGMHLAGEQIDHQLKRLTFLSFRCSSFR